MERLGKQVTLAHDQRVTCIGWSCDGSMLASGSVDNGIKFWGFDSAGHSRELRECTVHSKRLERLCWSHSDPMQLLSTASDKTIKVWDTRAGRCMNSLELTAEPLSLDFCQDGFYVCSGDKKDDLSLFDLRKMEMCDKLQAPPDTMVNDIKWNTAGTHLYVAAGATGNVGGDLLILDTRGGKLNLVSQTRVHTANCLAIDCSPQNNLLALGSVDSMVSIWDTASMVCLRTLTRADSQIRSLAFNFDGSLVAYGSADPMIYADDAMTGNPITGIDSSYVDAVSGLSYNPKANIVAYCGDEPKGTRVFVVVKYLFDIMAIGRFVWMTIPEKVLLYGNIRMLYTWAPILATDWGLSREQMSAVLTAGELAAIVAGFVTPAADKLGNRVMGIAAWVFAVACAALILLPPTFASILCIRVSASFAATVYLVCAQSSIINGLQGEDNRGLVTGLSETSWSISILCLIPLLSLFFDQFGWRATFGLFLALLCPFLAEIVFYFPEDKRIRRRVSDDDLDIDKRSSPWWKSLYRTKYMVVLRNPTALIFNLSSMFFNIAHNATFVCFTFWAVDEHDVDVEQMALVSFVIGAAELIGAALVMFAGDRFGMFNCIYVALGLYTSFTVLFFYLSKMSLYAGLAGISLLYVPGEFVIVAQIAMVEQFVGADYRSTLLGINFQMHFVGRAIGAAIAPAMYAAGGLQLLTIVGCSCAVVAFVLVAMSHRRFHKPLTSEIELQNGTEVAII